MGTRDRIIELHKRGLANAQIAWVVGVTRQRVWAVLHPEARHGKYDVSADDAFANAGRRFVRLTTKGVAAFLGVHPNTIRRWSDEGLIPCLRLGPRHDRRFDPQLVLESISKTTH